LAHSPSWYPAVPNDSKTTSPPSPASSAIAVATAAAIGERQMFPRHTIATRMRPSWHAIRALEWVAGQSNRTESAVNRTLQGPDGFPLGLPLGHLFLEVGPALGVGLAHLADRCHVDGVVRLPVAPTRRCETRSPRTVDGSGAVVGGRLVPSDQLDPAHGDTGRRSPFGLTAELRVPGVKCRALGLLALAITVAWHEDDQIRA